ncbi:GNAT family N-acetyltransferase [Rhodobacteraceae bacterium XHP0102]|nr:GNAT family N-acetyltransferase [Rhodobacteraceae bacterium XHP0102]
MISLAPTLQTERLTLRPMHHGDFLAYAALMASTRSIYMGGPYDTAAAWGLFCHDAGCWALFGHGALMMDRHGTNETVGQVGLNAGPLFPETELGWIVYEGYEGQGYATEGAAALRDWGFDNLTVESLVSYTDPRNGASQAVARRLGAVEDRTAQRQDPEDLVYRHHRRVS